MAPTWGYYGKRTPSKQLLSLLDGVSQVACDVETISLKDRDLVGLAIAVSPTDSFYFSAESSDLPWDILTQPDVNVIYHNSLFDLAVLYDYSVQSDNIEDTIMMARLLNLPQKLSQLSHWSGRETSDMGEVLAGYEVKKVSELPMAIVAEKSCQDVLATYGLFHKLKGDVDWAYYRSEMALVPILLRMSKRGIALNHDAIQKEKVKLERVVQWYRDYADREWAMNIASNKQLAYMLTERGSVLPWTRSRKNLSVAADVLGKLDDPLAKMVLAFRKVNKMLTTYVRPYAEADRAYAEFYLDTVTGRLSSRNRNLQNIPLGIRHAFIPDSGIFTGFDYSQVEMRIFAWRCGDPAMVDVYEHDGDIHQATSDSLHIPRKRGKNTNFAMIYGATVATVAATAGVSSVEASSLIDGYFQAYPKAGEWIRETQEEALRTGFTYTIGGRKMALPMYEGAEAIKRKAVNWDIQGSAAEIIKEAMRRCEHMDMVAQLHDELLLDGYYVDELRTLDLDRITEVYTPIDITTGVNWRDLK